QDLSKACEWAFTVPFSENLSGPLGRRHYLKLPRLARLSATRAAAAASFWSLPHGGPADLPSVARRASSPARVMPSTSGATFSGGPPEPALPPRVRAERRRRAGAGSASARRAAARARRPPRQRAPPGPFALSIRMRRA